MIANIITGFRVLASMALLFCPVFSPAFYTLYLIAGLSDMIDGTIARRTNSASEFGARFDTLADTVFVVVCLIKLLPAISMQTGLCVDSSDSTYKGNQYRFGIHCTKEVCGGSFDDE